MYLFLRKEQHSLQAERRDERLHNSLFVIYFVPVTMNVVILTRNCAATGILTLKRYVSFLISLRNLFPILPGHNKMT